MSQVISARSAAGTQYLSLPDPEVELLPGVRWDSHEYVFTPAFWAAHAWQCSLAGQLPQRHRLGSTLREEVAACLLGGYGIPAEVGLAAYALLRDSGMLERRPTEAELRAALTEPLWVHGRSVHYRFAHQKAAYLSCALDVLDDGSSLEPLTDVELRDWFTDLPGIGLKTASWITRNLRDSDSVAIIDVHVFRAGRLAGIFPASASIARDYGELEQRFLNFASALAVPASRLDALIWDFMRRVGPLAVSSAREAREAVTLDLFRQDSSPPQRA
jgi:thermostable 8-oxoguanine DNA glycosylase